MDSAHLKDEELIERVLQGQRELFGSLVERYWSTAVGLAVCRCGQPTAAEDLVQNSFIKAFVNLPKLRNHKRFGGWLSRIVVQECQSYHRMKKRHHQFVPFDPQAAGQFACAALENPGLTQKQIEFVHASVRRLPTKLQQVVLMRFIGGFTVKQIAEQLGKNVNTVRVRLHRALKMLHITLAPMLEEVRL